MKLFSNELQPAVFIAVVVLITLPLSILALTGSIKNESHLILFLPFLFGLPWNFILLKLPIDIPGITSKGVPDPSGDLVFSLDQLLFLLIPVYLNIYLLVRGLIRSSEKNITSAKPDSLQKPNYLIISLELLGGFLLNLSLWVALSLLIFTGIKNISVLAFSVRLMILFILLFVLKKRRAIAYGCLFGFIIRPF